MTDSAEDRFDELLFHLREMVADTKAPAREAEALSSLALSGAAELDEASSLALDIEVSVAHDAGWHATHALQIALELTGQLEEAARLVPDIDFQSEEKWSEPPPDFPDLSEEDARAQVHEALVSLRDLLQSIPGRAVSIRSALDQAREPAPHVTALRELMHLWQHEAFPRAWKIFRLTWWLHRRADPAAAAEEDRRRVGEDSDDEADGPA